MSLTNRHCTRTPESLSSSPPSAQIELFTHFTPGSPPHPPLQVLNQSLSENLSSPFLPNTELNSELKLQTAAALAVVHLIMRKQAALRTAVCASSVRENVQKDALNTG